MVFYGLSALVALVFTFLNATMMAIVLDLEGGRAITWYVLAEGAMLLGLGIGAVSPSGRKVIRLLLGWKSLAAPPDEPLVVYPALVNVLRNIVPVSAVAVLVCELPAVLVAQTWSDRNVATWVLMLGISLTVAGAALFIFLLIEIVLRPLLTRLRESTPPEWDPPQASLSLRTRIVVAVPIMTVLSGYYAVGLTSDASDETRFTLGIFAAIIWSLSVGLLLAGTFSQSLTEPVDDLVQATEQVERGNLEIRVRSVSGDEVGVLSARFNEMVTGLRTAQSELAASRARVVAAADAERRRFERDVHDGAQQELVLLRLKLSATKRMVSDMPAALAAIEELEGDSKRALDELRDLAHGLYPAALEEEGVAAALAEAGRRSAHTVRVTVKGVGRHPRELEAAVYFTCLEALQNATKHAGDDATVTIELAEADGMLRVVVADDGAGFDASTRNGSHGLQNMADRLGALGGTLTIGSTPGDGTRITGSVPIRR